MSDESILSMMTTYDEEFKKSTDLAKSNMLSSFSSVIAEVTGMIHGKDSTQYADAIAQANKYSAANISYGYGSTASPVATSTSSTTETNNSSSLSIGDININVNGGSNISTKDLADQIMEGITNVIYQKGYNPSKS